MWKDITSNWCIATLSQSLAALIIVPVNLLHQWHEELLTYCSEILNDEDICIVRKATDNTVGRVCLVPYSIIDKLVETAKIIPEMFGVVIADESHNLKSIDAKRTNSVLPFLKRANVAICMTGTPAVNRPVELYTQLNALLPMVFNQYEQFATRYCDAKPNKFAPGLDVRGSSNEAELKILLEGLVMIRRLKNDVIKSLPIKLRELRYVDPDSKYASDITKIQKRSAIIEESIRNTMDDVKRRSLRTEQEQLLLQYYQITGLSKIKAIKKELIQQINEARLQRAVDQSNQGNTKQIILSQQILFSNQTPQMKSPNAMGSNLSNSIDLTVSPEKEVNSGNVNEGVNGVEMEGDDLIDSESDEDNHIRTSAKSKSASQYSKSKDDGAFIVDSDDSDNESNGGKKKRKLSKKKTQKVESDYDNSDDEEDLFQLHVENDNKKKSLRESKRQKKNDKDKKFDDLFEKDQFLYKTNYTTKKKVDHEEDCEDNENGVDDEDDEYKIEDDSDNESDDEEEEMYLDENDSEYEEENKSKRKKTPKKDKKSSKNNKVNCRFVSWLY